MPPETRVTPDGYLDIKSTELNAWVRLFAPTKVVGGQDVRFVGEQSAKFTQIAANVAKIQDIVNKTTDINTAIKEINIEFDDLIARIKDVGTTVNDAGIRISNIQQIVAKLEAAVSENTASVSSTSQTLTSILNAIRDIKVNLETLTLIRERLDELVPASDSFEQTIFLVARNETPVPLPAHTKILSFTGRRDALGRFRDIRWSFVQGNIAKGVYKTLWGGGEEYQDKIDLSDKVLYLWCEEAISVELIAYF